MIYKCPVCNGKGIVPIGFYDLSGTSTFKKIEDKCRSCNGTGIITDEQIFKVFKAQKEE